MKKFVLSLAIASASLAAMATVASTDTSTETFSQEKALEGAYTVYPGGITILNSAAMATPINNSRHR